MKKPVQASLGFFVIFLHVTALVFALQYKETATLKKKPLVVNTKVFIPKPPPPTIRPASNPTPQKQQPAPKPKQPKQAKQPTKPKEQKKQQTTPRKPKEITRQKITPRNKPQKQPVVKQTPPRQQIPQSLLDELEESIAKIHKKPDKEYSNRTNSTQKIAAPTLRSTSITLATNVSSDYQSKLIACLHETLHLPEHGEVKVELTLSSDGRLLRLQVLSAESKRNKTYLEDQLHHVTFPPISSGNSSTKEHSFTLSFTHEI